MKDILPGLKTKINGWIMAILPIIAMIGIEIDPATVQAFLQEFWIWIAGGYALLGSFNHWFRNLA
jgi:hypothetical protein